MNARLLMIWLLQREANILAKQKLCYGWYESISAKYTTHNSLKRRTWKICLGKHPTSLRGFQHKKKDGATKGNS